MLERTYPGLLGGGWKDLAYEHFRDGIAVHWLAEEVRMTPRLRS